MDKRMAFVTGLANLRTFLLAHPEMPLPEYPSVYVFLRPDGPEQISKALAEIGRIAQILGTKVQNRLHEDGHYEAIRDFGGITYNAILCGNRVPPELRPAETDAR
jgi:hypothetical protein